MQLSFNLENIKYLKLKYKEGGRVKNIQLALKEKQENNFIAVIDADKVSYTETPQQIAIDFITTDGLYSTETTLKEVKKDDEYAYFVIGNPTSLDYQQNREYYRVISKNDCIYTVDKGGSVESYDTVTYDISAGGVSIIMEEIAISQEETSIVIFTPGRDIKSHLNFVRCEIFDKDKYKLSFEFTDLSDVDYEILHKLCLEQQLHDL